MNVKTALRAPCHARTLVRAGSAAPLDLASLGRAQLVAQGGLSALCAARLAVDATGGSLSFEGGAALVILVLVAASVLVKAAFAGSGRGGHRRIASMKAGERPAVAVRSSFGAA